MSNHPHHHHSDSAPSPAAPVVSAGVLTTNGRFVKPAAFAGTPLGDYWCQIQGCGSADTDPDAQKDWNLEFADELTIQNDDPLDPARVVEAHDYGAEPYAGSGAYPVLPNALVFPRANGAWPGFTLAECSQYAKNCTASGKWNLPDHSNRGVVAGE